MNADLLRDAKKIHVVEGVQADLFPPAPFACPSMWQTIDGGVIKVYVRDTELFVYVSDSNPRIAKEFAMYVNDVPVGSIAPDDIAGIRKESPSGDELNKFLRITQDLINKANELYGSHVSISSTITAHNAGEITKIQFAENAISAFIDKNKVEETKDGLEKYIKQNISRQAMEALIDELARITPPEFQNTGFRMILRTAIWKYFLERTGSTNAIKNIISNLVQSKKDELLDKKVDYAARLIEDVYNFKIATRFNRPTLDDITNNVPYDKKKQFILQFLTDPAFQNIKDHTIAESTATRASDEKNTFQKITRIIHDVLYHESKQ